MFKKITIAAALTAFISASFFTSVSAQKGSYVLQRIIDRGSINMGHREASVPFAYIKDGNVQGYSIDLCNMFIEKIKSTLKMPDLKVKLVPVTSQTRLALIANGTIDMECGSTTNNLTRQKQVDYLPVTFITGTKLASKKGSGITEIEDMEGKVIALSQGTTNEKAVKRIMKAQGIKIKIVNVKDHPQAWLALTSGRVDAYATDDVLLYGLISKAKNPDQWQVTGRFLSFDPYSLMVPRDDSTYRRIGTVLLADLMRSGEMLKIYDKWFNPGPTGINMPISDTLRVAFEIQALPH
ncbi:MAG: amino acid ABC transporter substrate-binding protein [Proteobacteria bacterium]|nr:amino acid ABC transporter substrate-binding protein [Pseudomonadota bacterium]